MRRRIAIAVILPATAGVAAALYLSGLAWPIANTVWSLIAPRPDSQLTEPDPVG